MKRSRIRTYYSKSKEIKKDSECSTYCEYGEAIAFKGEVWPASGKIQAELYGERLPYIRNVRIEGAYVITTDRKNIVHYVYANGLDIVESSGLCLYVSSDSEPDYKVISVKPYDPLRLEAKKL